MKTFTKKIELTFRKGLIKFLKLFLANRDLLSQLPNPNQPYKILLLRPARIGDLIVSTPVINELSNKFPHYTLDLLLSKKNGQLLSADTKINQKFIYKKNLIGIIRLIYRLHQERYDIIIDLAHDRSTTLLFLTWILNTPYRIGLAKKTDYIYNIIIPQKITSTNGHMIDVLGQLLQAFGCPPENLNLKPYYPISPQRQEWARNLLKTEFANLPTIIAINISASSKRRFWGIQNFRIFCQQLLIQYPHLGCFLLYAPSDYHQAQEIRANIASDRCKLFPPTRHIDDFAALIDAANILISPDTSAIHFASALNKPVVGLFQRKNRQWYPYDVPSRIVETTKGLISSIPVEDVMEAFEDLYNELNLS